MIESVKLLPATFLELSAQLANTSSLVEKKRLTKQMSAFLAQDKDFSSLLLRSLLMSCLQDIELLNDVIANEFYKIRHSTYRDEDGVLKVSVGIAFLQNFLNANGALDRLLLENVIKELASNNLDLLVNDVVVNNVQVRNGDLNNLL